MNFTELVALCHMSCIFISRTIALIVSHRDHSHSRVLTRIQKFSMIYSYGTLRVFQTDLLMLVVFFSLFTLK